MFRINSIKFKFSILYSLILGVILLLFSTVLYFMLSYYLYSGIDNRLRLKAAETITTINAYTEVVKNREKDLEFAVEKIFFYNTDNYPVRMFDRSKIKELDTQWQARFDVLGLDSDYSLFILSPSKTVLKTKNFSPKLLNGFLLLAKTPREGIGFYNLTIKKKSYRVIAVPYITKGQRHMLAIGTSQDHVRQVLVTFLQATCLGIPLVLLFTSFIGRLFVQRVLSPIDEIANTAQNISHHDLSARVKTPHIDVEIQHLIASFNGMIGRLEKSFQHINEFSSQVAHELKTPLAIMKGEAELALSEERKAGEYKAALAITLEESNRMRQTIEDLLLLARLDYQPDVFQFQSIDFSEFIQEIFEQTKILSDDKGIQVEADIPKEEVRLQADKLHLRRMFFNIISNALKFTLPPGKITIRVIYRRRWILILISDTGVGIFPADLPNIFKKFYHVDRTGRNEGASSGLGLSIVQSVLKVHKGHVRVTSKVNVGTTFHVLLPRLDVIKKY